MGKWGDPMRTIFWKNWWHQSWVPLVLYVPSHFHHKYPRYVFDFFFSLAYLWKYLVFRSPHFNQIARLFSFQCSSSMSRIWLHSISRDFNLHSLFGFNLDLGISKSATLISSSSESSIFKFSHHESLAQYLIWAFKNFNFHTNLN